jgi:uncharacterized protein
MLVNLTDVFANEGQVQEITASYEADTFTNQLGTFEIKEKSPVSLKLSNIGQSRALIRGTAKLVIRFACDRCLRDVDYTFDLSFDDEVVSPEYTGEVEEDDCLDDCSRIMEGYHLNVDELVNNEILLNWPLKILCKQDCKGLCKVCGKNLNDGDCGCDDFVPDPRMAAIKDIFNANKEV